MLASFVKSTALGAVCIPCAGVGLCYSPYVMHSEDSQLRLVAYDYMFQDKPATALVYSFYLNHYPKEFFILWKGKKIATEYIWYDNGKLMTERPYENGLPHGDWKMWYEDGRAKSLKHYVRGEIDGEMWAWHSNGQVSDFNLYADGKELTHKSWVSDGTPYYNYVYQDGQKIGMKGGDFCKRLEVFPK